MNKEERLDNSQSKSILNWILLNSGSNSSVNKNKTPYELGYTAEDYQKIELGFEEVYGSDLITVFFQKKGEKNGKSFRINRLDAGAYDLLFKFYMYRREMRKTVYSTIDILNTVEAAPIPKEDSSKSNIKISDFEPINGGNY